MDGQWYPIEQRESVKKIAEELRVSGWYNIIVSLVAIVGSSNKFALVAWPSGSDIWRVVFPDVAPYFVPVVGVLEIGEIIIVDIGAETWHCTLRSSADVQYRQSSGISLCAASTTTCEWYPRTLSPVVAVGRSKFPSHNNLVFAGGSA